jgi:hypothetical protein
LIAPLCPLATSKAALRPDCFEEEDAADDLAVFEHVLVVVAPLAG